MLPLWFFACTGIGALVGRFAIDDTWAGLNVGILMGLLPMFVLGLLGLLIGLVDQERPVCRCGRGKSDDYDYIEHTNDEPRHYDYRCRCCGRVYRHREMVFYELTGEGHEAPYMKKKGFRWKPVPDTWRELAYGGEG